MRHPLSIICTLLLTVITHAQTQAASPSTHHRSTTLVCEDRKIEVQGDCFQDDPDIPKLSCLKVQINFIDTKTNKVLETRYLKPDLKNTKRLVIKSEIGDLICAEAANKEKYIIAMFGTGGNCEDCEWLEAFTWGGKFIGSSRDKNKDIKKLVDLAGDAAFNPRTKKIIAQTTLTGFYTPDVKPTKTKTQ